MFPSDQYSLLDFGNGRKLERFGPVVLDRPSPAAGAAPCRQPTLWDEADARFLMANETSGQRGRWVSRNALSERWTIEHTPLRFELRPTEFGHIGVFPEQAENWDWIGRQVAAIRSILETRRPRVLNLFAYTGASTLAAATAGAEVVHVDAAKSTVVWARRNAALSGLAGAPIHWIVEDAPKFVVREQKRGTRYHGIILDPPSYGHGPAGQAWQLDRDLTDLLAVCRALLVDDGSFVLLTCHTSGIGPTELSQELLAAIPAARPSDIDAHDLFLLSADGRQLHSGVMARWSSPTG